MSMFRELMMANTLPYKKLQYLAVEQLTFYTQTYLDLGNLVDFTKMQMDFFSDVPGTGGSNRCFFFGTKSVISGFIGMNVTNGVFSYDSVTFASASFIPASGTAYAKNSVSVEYTLSASAVSRRFQIGGYDPASHRSNCRWYGIKLYADGVLAKEFIPVLWNANTPYVDGNTGATVTPTAAKPGMFDKVSKRLFVNQGTGADFSYA